MLGNLSVKICRTSSSQLPAQQLEKTYTIQQQVGQGKYGQVYKAISKTNKEVVALKKIKQEKEASGFPRTAMREIHLLSQIKHKNIISYKEVVVQSKNTFLVLEYMDTDLQRMMDKKVNFSQDQIRYLMYQILDGLSYLNSKNIYHRDLKRINKLLQNKANNILYNNKGIVKLCDFGMANYYIKTRPQTKRVLIPQYRAPEIYFGQLYDCAVDVWSAGILILVLIVKPDPFLVAKTEFQCFNKIIDLCGTPNEGLNYIFSFMMIGLMFSNCPITTILQEYQKREHQENFYIVSLMPIHNQQIFQIRCLP